MSKSRILQIVGSITILLGVFMLYEHFTNVERHSSLLAGIGAIISGIAGFIMSRSKAITKKESE